MAENETFDYVVIGGGPGGYVSAIRAAQLGMSTAIIEKRKTLGGTCVNVGCIPSKALLDSSEQYHKAKEGLDVHGITVKDVKLDVSKMMERKTKIVKELTDGLAFLMNKNKIKVFEGHGSFKGKSGDKIEIEVKGENSTVITAKNCTIATGSEVIRIPGAEIDEKDIISSDSAIALDKVPEHLVVIGGGVIGLEMGSVWNRLGSKVTVIEMLPDILMNLDNKMRTLARRILTKQGLEFMFEHKVTEAKTVKNGVEIKAEDKDGNVKEIKADKLLVSVGRKPYTESLNLEAVGVQLTDRGRVKVDPHTLKTDAGNIYAIGDVIDGPMLAHKAEEEGVMVAEILAGKPGHVNYNTCPYIVYTHPEIAWAGKSEEDLKKEGIEYSTGQFLFRPNGRAKAMNEPDGQVRILADKKTDKLLGCSVIGPGAADLLQQAIVCMEFGGSSEDLGRSFFGHPTLSEAMKEAALDATGISIHQ